MTRRSVTHTINGDRVLVTAALPAEAVTAAPGKTIDVTMDATEWHDVAKAVLRQQRIAERDVSPEVVCANVESLLRREIRHAVMDDHQEPVVIRRRAIAHVLNRLADLCLAGTVDQFMVDWIDPYVEIAYETGRGDRRRMRRIECCLVADLEDEAALTATLAVVP